MQTIRRWYIFLVCAISLNVVAWALVEMLRMALASELRPALDYATPIAVVIAALPLFFVHWMWAQRIAAREPGERDSFLRQLYLHGSATGFLIPILVYGFDIALRLTGRSLGLTNEALGLFDGGASGDAVLIHKGAAVAVLAPLWAYQRWVARRDLRMAGPTENGSMLQRVYLLGFAFAGILMVTLAAQDLLLMAMRQFGTGAAIPFTQWWSLAYAIAGLTIGLPLWLIPWSITQRRFSDGASGERESAVRKLYLYALIFIGVMATTLTIAALLSAFIMRFLGVDPDGDLREPLATLIVAGALWVYHAGVLRRDESAATEAPRQASIRRVYLYLVAGIGLVALLGGVIGMISTLIERLDGRPLDDDLRQQVAVAAAAIIVGMPVWILPWQRSQAAARVARGEGERTSLARRFYLYLFLFLATLAVLGSAIYILSRLLSLALGGAIESGLLSDMAMAVAFLLMGMAVWVYHGTTLRGDGKRSRLAAAEKLSGQRVIIVNDGRGWAEALRAQMKMALPTLEVETLSPDVIAVPAIDDASLIVARPNALVEGPSAITAAIRASGARKLLVPTAGDGWEYTGVEPATEAEMIENTIESVRRIAAGEPAVQERRLNAGAIAGMIAAGVLAVLALLFVLFLAAVSGAF